MIIENVAHSLSNSKWLKLVSFTSQSKTNANIPWTKIAIFLISSVQDATLDGGISLYTRIDKTNKIDYLISSASSYHQQSELIEASKQGSRDAQRAIYDLYVDAMYSTCYRMMGNQHDAEDQLMESFTDAFRAINQFQYKSTFGAWLKRIVVNNCITTLKKNRLDIKELSDNVAQIPAHDTNNDLENNLPTASQIKALIVELPDGYRQILSLYLLEGYDHIEISKILEISVGTSKSQYSRAKIKLKELLKIYTNG